MLDALTAAARTLATRAGAPLLVTPGVAVDLADAALCAMAEALRVRLAAVGADLVSVRRTEGGLHAVLDQTDAEEPISPLAFRSVVRELAWQRFRECWDGSFNPAPAAARQRRAA